MLRYAPVCSYIYTHQFVEFVIMYPSVPSSINLELQTTITHKLAEIKEKACCTPPTSPTPLPLLTLSPFSLPLQSVDLHLSLPFPFPFSPFQSPTPIPHFSPFLPPSLLLATHSHPPYLLVGQEHTVGMFMLTGHLVPLQSLCQLVDKAQHFFMPWDVCHGDA